MNKFQSTPNRANRIRCSLPLQGLKRVHSAAIILALGICGMIYHPFAQADSRNAMAGISNQCSPEHLAFSSSGELVKPFIGTLSPLLTQIESIFELLGLHAFDPTC